MKKLTLYAPSYYKEFRCIKGDCKHSCCIGWEIDVDSEAIKKYNTLSGEIGESIKNSISSGDTPHFILSNNRCPHLDDSGLCRIISNLGDGYLCDICRHHPRFYNVTKRGIEVGLGASCEEAARILLSSDGYRDIESIGEDFGEPLDFDVFPLRDKLYSILSNTDKPYAERLFEIYESFSVSPAVLSDCEWREVLSSLEYLNPESKSVFASYSSDVAQTKSDIILERALAYFAYRHASSAESAEDFRMRLGFALVLERLLASCIKATNIPAVELLRTISEEIEYSVDNTDALIAEMEFAL